MSTKSPSTELAISNKTVIDDTAQNNNVPLVKTTRTARVTHASNAYQMLPPVTVLGTGFLRQIILDNDAADDAPWKRLVSWPLLLESVAREKSLLNVFDSGLASSFPTLQWDELVRAHVASCDTSDAAHKMESELKKVVSDVLAEATTHAKVYVDQAKLQAFLAAAGQHIVSLNLDTLVLGDTFAGKTIFDKSQRGVQHVKHGEKTFWFPHGCIQKPDSIRLGLRDYGFLPHEWSTLFGGFKGFERAELANKKQPLTPEESEFVKNKLRNGEPKPQHQLLGQLMLAPLIFFGAGMSNSEWGLWWVLNQRARNLARVALRDRPPTVIVLSSQEVERLPFWCTRPAGLTPIFVNNWDKGWSILLEWLKQHQPMSST